MSKDLFKEAIADAKAVREAALANAKLALEEAFTPHIKEMLAAKIEEMDKEYEMEEAKMTDDMEEGKEMETEAQVDETYNEDGTVEEELSLEEILAALEEAEKAESVNEDELEEAKKKKASKEEEKEDLDEVIDLEALLAEAEEEEEEETEEASEEEEEEVGEMTVEELKDLIRSIVGEMGGGEETEMPAAEKSSEEMEMVDLDEILAESEELEEAEELEEGVDVAQAVLNSVNQLLTSGEFTQNPTQLGLASAALAALFLGAGGVGVIKDLLKSKSKSKEKITKAEIEDLPKSETVSEVSDETLAEIEALRTELNETNLLNAKLLYSNKIFRANELNENQKLRVINAFDKASNVNEAKLIYETIKDSFTTAKEKKQIKESLGFASKPTGASKSRIIDQPDNTVARLQKLAGII